MIPVFLAGAIVFMFGVIVGAALIKSAIDGFLRSVGDDE